MPNSTEQVPRRDIYYVIIGSAASLVYNVSDHSKLSYQPSAKVETPKELATLFAKVPIINHPENVRCHNRPILNQSQMSALTHFMNDREIKDQLAALANILEIRNEYLEQKCREIIDEGSYSNGLLYELTDGSSWRIRCHTNFSNAVEKIINASVGSSEFKTVVRALCEKIIADFQHVIRVNELVDLFPELLNTRRADSDGCEKIYLNAKQMTAVLHYCESHGISNYYQALDLIQADIKKFKQEQIMQQRVVAAEGGDKQQKDVKTMYEQATSDFFRRSVHRRTQHKPKTPHEGSFTLRHSGR